MQRFPNQVRSTSNTCRTRRVGHHAYSTRICSHMYEEDPRFQDRSYQRSRDRKGVFQLYEQYPVTMEMVKNAIAMNHEMTYLDKMYQPGTAFLELGIDEEMVKAYFHEVDKMEKVYKSVEIEEQ